MSIAPNVSLLGSSSAQINRLTDMRKQLDDLERQIGTQKKYETMTDFGLATHTILQLRADRNRLQAYTDNIDTAMSNVKSMSNALIKISGAVTDMISLLQNQPQDEEFDATLINTQARQAINFVTDVANLNLTGRYMFAGTDSQTAPVADTDALNAGALTLVNDWLSGAGSTAQTITDMDALSGTALGFSPTLSSAQNIVVRINEATEISYGGIADRTGVQEVLRALGMMANLRAPDPATDTPTNAEFGTLIEHILSVARTGITDMQNTQGQMSSAIILANNIQETHKDDINLYSSQIGEMEDADATSVIARLQALQTQLTASYETTRITSQLSLANYIS